MKTRSIPGFEPFVIPAEPEEVARHSRVCCQAVLEGEYAYRRTVPEDVTSAVDVGCNCAAFIVWAARWWPKLERVFAVDPNRAAVEIADINIRTNPLCRRLGVLFMTAAVTVDPHPRFRLQDNWGGSRTYGETEGEAVDGLHPAWLPPADVLKVDAEGVDLEVFEHYRHWSRVKVAIFEYHREEHREPMERICADAGLAVVRRPRPEETMQDVEVWVRP